MIIALSPTSPPPPTLYRHRHRIAGRILALAAEAIVVPEVRVETRPALTTLVPTLDRILGSFEAGKITLIDSGSDFVFHLTTLLSVRAVMEGHEVVFLDGGNSVDPHGMVALGKRAAMTREEILPRVHVARAFTCHQMTTLILDMLDKKIEETRAGLVLIDQLGPAVLVGFFSGLLLWISIFPLALREAQRRIARTYQAVLVFSIVCLAAFAAWLVWFAVAALL